MVCEKGGKGNQMIESILVVAAVIFGIYYFVVKNREEKQGIREMID